MNTSQLLCTLKCDDTLRKDVQGVYAVDALPIGQLEKYPCGFIVNTDPSGMPGKHWVAIYFDAYKTGEFFDSYGKRPEYYNTMFLTFLRRNALFYRYNNKKLQNDYSNVCGHYCVYFLMLRARQNSMQLIIDSLSFINSDQYVFDEISQMYAICFESSNLCKKNLICKSLIK